MSTIQTINVAHPTPRNLFSTCHSTPIALLIDSHRRLLETSATAEAMLDEGLVLERSFGRLTTTHQSDMARLESALGQSHLHGASSLRLIAKGLKAEVVLMDRNPEMPTYLILIRSSRSAEIIDAERIAKRFGLTPTESKLLNLLFKGLELKAAAMRLGVARTTARTHLQHIFDKTGVRRQVDLQRMAIAAAAPKTRYPSSAHLAGFAA